MALTNEQLTILATELRNDPKKLGFAALMDAQEYTAIAALLNVQPQVANPEPQPTVGARFTWETFLGLLSGAEIWGMYEQGGNLAADLRSALEGNNAGERNRLWSALKTVLPAGTVSNVEAAFASTQPDPNWSATVPGDSRATVLGLPRVTGADVQRVDMAAIAGTVEG